MRLEPYVAVNAIPFSATTGDILRLHGTPWRSGRNGVGLDELDYGEVVYRFQDHGRLEEITRQAEVLVLGNVHVPFARLAAFVRSQDARAFERAGFLVSPRYGIAFDPQQPAWVTALARHALPQWRAL